MFEFTEYVNDVDGDNVICKFIFTKKHDDFCEINVYDSKNRYFTVHKSWKPYVYYNNLFLGKQFNLCFCVVEGNLSIYLEGKDSYGMCIGEDLTSDNHLGQLYSELAKVTNKLEEIRQKINKVKSKHPNKDHKMICDYMIPYENDMGDY